MLFSLFGCYIQTCVHGKVWLYHGARLVRPRGRRASEAMLAPGSLSQMTLNPREALDENKRPDVDIVNMVRGPFITALSWSTVKANKALKSADSVR